MSPDSGSSDSGNDNPGTHGIGPETGPDRRIHAGKVSRLLADQQLLVTNLHAEAGSYPWSLPRERFEAALERSAAKRFGSETVSPEKIEEYLGALHLQDLSLAAACAEGVPEAWEHFVAT